MVTWAWLLIVTELRAVFRDFEVLVVLWLDDVVEDCDDVLDDPFVVVDDVPVVVEPVVEWPE